MPSASTRVTVPSRTSTRAAKRVQRPSHPDRSGQLVEDRVLPDPGRQHRQPRADLLGVERRAGEPVHPTHEHEPFASEQVRVELPFPPLPALARLQRQLPQARVAVRDAEDPGQPGRLLRADPDGLDHQDGGAAPRKLIGGREPADPGAHDDGVPVQARSFSRPGRFHGVIAVLDDDPTGSQTVYGATVVTALDEVAGEPLTFYWTNTRSLDETEAAQLTYDVARRLFESDPDVEIVSRSDSTLRGHVLAEVQAIDRARRDVLGAGYDGVLLAPAFFEAGRSHARRRALRGRHARGGDGVRAGRHVRVLVLEPRRLRGRAGRWRRAQPLARRRAASA